MAGEWREHAMLKGRFRSDYPDDLQVIVHDGGPQISRNEPEIVWVTVTGMDGDSLEHDRERRDGPGERGLRTVARAAPGEGYRGRDEEERSPLKKPTNAY
jgi:hypothetical protein